MKNAPPKFGFYEKVRIMSANEPLRGELAAVLGRSQDDQGMWHYSVYVYLHRACSFLAEDDLVSIGEFAQREDFYDGSSLRVYVDEEGRGHLADSQND